MKAVIAIISFQSNFEVKVLKENISEVSLESQQMVSLKSTMASNLAVKNVILTESVGYNRNKLDGAHSKLVALSDPLISSEYQLHNTYFCMQQIIVNLQDICRTKLNQFNLFLINSI